MKRVLRNGAAATALTLGVTLTFGSALALTALPASAAGDATVTVGNENGTNEALIAGGTTLDLEGSGFQSVVGGQGGIYVAFGWVDDPESGNWAPSTGGENGGTYKLAPDDELADNGGYLKFVTFPGGATGAAANGGVLAEDGTWATDLAIPASQFDSKDRDGNPTTVDCLKVQCGIVTIGAHNIKNANNETFTPVDFVDEYATAATGTSAAGDTDGETQSDAADSDSDSDATAAADADGSVEADAASDAPATKTDEVAPNRSIQFGIVGAVLVVGVLVLRQILRRRSNG